jgi:hypothetical protein
VKARIAALAAVLAGAAALSTAVAIALEGGAAPARTSPVGALQTRQRAADVICSGPETLLAPVGGDAVDPRADLTVAAVVAPGQAPGAGLSTVRAELSPLATGPGAGARPSALLSTSVPAGRGAAAFAGTALERLAGPGATRLQMPQGTTSGVTAAVQTTVARRGDLRALVAHGCGTAGTDTWLVGGGTQTGRRGRLLLANPAPTPALVDVTVLGPEGPVRAPAGDGVVVPATGEVALLVDALAPGLERIAVHVRARTGRVVSTLHDTVLRGLVPGGADDVPAAHRPARRQVVPGVSVQSAPAGSAREAAALRELTPDRPGASAIRVAVPGREEGVVRVRLLGPEGEVQVPAEGVVAVPPGSVVDVPLTGVPDGTYGAVVESDVPVLAAALVGRAVRWSLLAGTGADPTGRAPPAEFGWSAAGTALDGTALVALPPTGAFSSRDAKVAVSADARAAAKQAADGASGRSARVQRALAREAALAVIKGGPVSSTLALTAAGRAGRVEVTVLNGKGEVRLRRLFAVAAGTTRAVRVIPGAAALLMAPAGGGAVVAATVVQATDAAGPLISVLPVTASGGAASSSVAPAGDPRLGLRR